MARKVTITKEKILETALKMLIRDGYSSINIKTLAAEIGCSTQPIVWHFENMEGLRTALAVYAREYATKKEFPQSKNPIDAFENMGKAYVKMAVKEPNLFKFLYLGESPINKPFKLKDITRGNQSGIMADGIAKMTGITKEASIRCVSNTIIYSHGLATMVATGVFKASEKEIMSMIKSASESFLRQEGGKING